MVRISLAALAAVVLMATGAAAQPAEPSTKSEQAQTDVTPSPRAVELARRLFVAMHLDHSIHDRLQIMLPEILAAQQKQMPGFKPEWRQPLVDAAVGALDDIMPAYLKNAEAAYARTFTEDELAQAVAYYESPAGQAMLAKGPQLTTILAKDMASRMEGLSADIHLRFCRTTNTCNGAAKTSQAPA